jgi:1,4-alpha-glucan branching enzyme
MWSHPGKQLLFSGCEFAQDAEWSEQAGLDWWLLDNPAHRGVFRLVQDLNATYRARPALWEQDTSANGFSWLAANDGDHNVFAFVRWAFDGRPLVCVVNFAGVPWEGYSLPLPLGTDRAQVWSEVLNTDAEQYGGSGVGNFGQVYAIDEGQDGWPARTVLRLPPLGALWLEPQPIEDAAALAEEAAQAATEAVGRAEAIASAEAVAVAETDEVAATLPGMRSEPVSAQPGLRAEPVTTDATALEAPQVVEAPAPKKAAAKRTKR